jgi:hypothetical protein
MPKITMANPAATYASSTDNGETPAIHIIVVVVSPTTLPEPPAFDARRSPRDSRDALCAEHDARDCATDQRRGNVVEEGRQHEDHDQQYEGALPVIGQQRGQPCRNLACFEMLRKQREAQQQSEQIDEQHPFMRKMQNQTR